MADKRKLQAEIDRCIKKVQEGVEEFDEIWAKVQEATNANQKEKYETDLKKEIKKLQRQREQIKGWLNSNEIKDKSQLQDYRRIIEQKMEQFKVVERETKTKAYSKQGLGAEQKLDPKEKEKEETIGWLQECIEKLSTQNDKFESEIEQLSATAGKKKKLDKDKQEKLDELRRQLERHKFHIQQLELLMRLLTNNSLESNQVVKIRDDLEYYITNNQEDSFEENEFMYDDLNLGDVEQLAKQLGNIALTGLDESENNSETNTTASVSPSASPAPSHNSKDSNKGSDDIKLRHASGEEVVKPVVARTVSTTAISRSTPTTPLKFTSQTSVESALSTPPMTSTPPPPPPGMSYNSVAAGTKPASASKVLAMVTRTTSEPPSAVPPLESTPPKYADTPILQQSLSASSSSSFQSTTMLPPIGQQTPQILQQQISVSGSTSGSSSTQPVVIPPPPPTHPMVSSPVVESLSITSNASSMVVNGSLNETKQMNEDETAEVMTLKALAEKVAATTSESIPPSSNLPPSSVTSPITPTNVMQANSNNLANTAANVGQSLLSSLLNNTSALQSQQTQEAKIPPSLGASPLGKLPLSQDHMCQLGALENAMHHMPMPADSERLRNYLPRSPCQVPSHYPQSPPPMADLLEYFNRLHNETLFFIFYYMEGTKAQYLAAKALKRQSWRFHTKYMMWFQRHEEPKTITDEYEQGTYIYFDFEKWAQRKKENFTFEYRFLEDKEMS